MLLGPEIHRAKSYSQHGKTTPLCDLAMYYPILHVLPHLSASDEFLDSSDTRRFLPFEKATKSDLSLLLQIVPCRNLY